MGFFYRLIAQTNIFNVALNATVGVSFEVTVYSGRVIYRSEFEEIGSIFTQISTLGCTSTVDKSN